jgi:hypothetical protein
VKFTATGELSDAELEAVAGGRSRWIAFLKKAVSIANELLNT